LAKIALAKNKDFKMGNQTSNYEYFKNKKSDKVYLSQRLENKVYLPSEDGNVEVITFDELYQRAKYIVDFEQTQ
jgi:hypothetical protein